MFTRISHISLIISCYCSQPIGHLCTPPPFLARSFDKGIILVLAKSFGEIRHLVDSRCSSSGCGNIIVLWPGFDLSSPSHQPGLITLTIVSGQSYHLTISQFPLCCWRWKTFSGHFGYETTAHLSWGEDDLIKVLNATSLYICLQPLPFVPPFLQVFSSCEHTWYRDVNIYYILNITSATVYDLINPRTGRDGRVLGTWLRRRFVFH